MKGNGIIPALSWKERRTQGKKSQDCRYLGQESNPGSFEQEIQVLTRMQQQSMYFHLKCCTKLGSIHFRECRVLRFWRQKCDDIFRHSFDVRASVTVTTCQSRACTVTLNSYYGQLYWQTKSISAEVCQACTITWGSQISRELPTQAQYYQCHTVKLPVTFQGAMQAYWGCRGRTPGIPNLSCPLCILLCQQYVKNFSRRMWMERATFETWV
jgi:hypothetical protein